MIANVTKKMWSNYWAKCLIDVLLISQMVTLNQQSCAKRASQRDNKSDCQQLLMIENLENIVLRNIQNYKHKKTYDSYQKNVN